MFLFLTGLSSIGKSYPNHGVKVDQKIQIHHEIWLERVVFGKIIWTSNNVRVKWFKSELKRIQSPIWHFFWESSHPHYRVKVGLGCGWAYILKICCVGRGCSWAYILKVLISHDTQKIHRHNFSFIFFQLHIN